jgi:hypothetical protein
LRDDIEVVAAARKHIERGEFAVRQRVSQLDVLLEAIHLTRLHQLRG